MNKNKKEAKATLRKIFIILPLLLFSFITLTVTTYAWWDMLTQTENEIINIGEGTTLVVQAVAVAPSGKVLVPAGTAMKANDVDEIVLTYNVKLNKTVLTALNLSVTESNVKIGDDATNANLVNINIILASSTVNSTDVLVTITVTLTEPTTEEIYDAIINKPITFTLTFSGTIA